jgi:phosphatidylglycerol:prolipoprotein diacylglycerol transferase
MIPYFELREIPIAAGRSVSVFGTLVAIGIFAGMWFSERRARVAGIPQQQIHGAIASVLLPGFLLAHAFALVPLAAGDAEWSPWTALQFWNGMSSFGGFAGAFLGLAFYCWRTRQSCLPLTDILMQALVFGWVFGRLGCTLVHDHIGTPSVFPLAIAFTGGSRHDLGLYELIYTLLVLVPAVIILNRAPRRPGTTVVVLALLYAPARFAGDFLRQVDLAGADERYLGLTLAQHGCIVLAGVGLAVAVRIRAQRLQKHRRPPLRRLHGAPAADSTIG